MSNYWDFNRFSSNLTLRLGLVVFCLSLEACSWIPKGESDLDVGIKERGMASWYGIPFHGRLAANGEVFDMEAMTAAHRTLPLGSMVRVVNLLNGKHVRVRINDRGPYVNGRILDLSHAAAAQLGMVEGGLSVIQLEVIGDHRPEFVVQSEEGALYASPPLMVHRLEDQSLIATPMHRFHRSNFTKVSIHRLLPNDVLVQRWWELAPAILAADPAHREHVALVLI
ncbi:MAG TPA: septal ring lytic transglycosylase RlpA family protein [Nitrospira sp.]|nr:septal ring lytic transglycosylase RlpA family protein [Nitrospira sp.]